MVATDHRKATGAEADGEVVVEEAITLLLEGVAHNRPTAPMLSSIKDSLSTQQLHTHPQAAIPLTKANGRAMDSRQRHINTPQYLSPPQTTIQTMPLRSNTPRLSILNNLPMDSNRTLIITKHLLRLVRLSGLAEDS